jgi:hypothetical protein
MEVRREVRREVKRGVRRVRRARRVAKKRSERRGEENGNSGANGLERTLRDLSHDAADVTMIKTHTSKVHMTFPILSLMILTCWALRIWTSLPSSQREVIPISDDTRILATVSFLRYTSIPMVSTLDSIYTAVDTGIRGPQKLDDLNIVSLISTVGPVSDVYDTTICTITFPTARHHLRSMVAATKYGIYLTSSHR